MVLIWGQASIRGLVYKHTWGKNGAALREIWRCGKLGDEWRKYSTPGTNESVTRNQTVLNSSTVGYSLHVYRPTKSWPQCANVFISINMWAVVWLNICTIWRLVMYQICIFNTVNVHSDCMLVKMYILNLLWCKYVTYYEAFTVG